MSSSDQIGIFQLIVIGLGILLFIVIGALAIIANIALFTYPLFVVFGLARVASTKAVAPRPANADDADMAQAEREIGEWGGRIRQSQIQRGQLYLLGKQNGLVLTQKSDETRFDVRSKLGRELNEKLEKLQSEHDLADEMIKMEKMAWNSNPYVEWVQAFETWKKRRSFQLALLFSIPVALIVNEYIRRSYNTFNVNGYNLEKLIAWHPSLDSHLAPAAVGAIAGYIAFFLIKKRLPSYLQKQMLHSQAKDWKDVREAAMRWVDLNEKWDEESDVFAHFEIRAEVDEDGAFANSEDSPFFNQASNTKQPWFEVLGVEENADADEIKTAYRTLIRSYHPDRLVGLGTKLQELGEEMSIKINLAYEEGKAAREFS